MDGMKRYVQALVGTDAFLFATLWLVQAQLPHLSAAELITLAVAFCTVCVFARLAITIQHHACAAIPTLTSHHRRCGCTSSQTQSNRPQKQKQCRSSMHHQVPSLPIHCDSIAILNLCFRVRDRELRQASQPVTIVIGRTTAQTCKNPPFHPDVETGSLRGLAEICWHKYIVVL